MLLFGWYLVSPLPHAASKGVGPSEVLVDADRPLRDWRITRSFGGAGECQAYLKDWIMEARLKASEMPKPPPADVLLELNTRANSMCVSSDDPRLRSR